MRIALVNWTNRKVGGAETYLDSILEPLLCRGHQLALWHEVDNPADRDRIGLGVGLPSWRVAGSGPRAAVASLRDWQPDVIYAHGLLSADLEWDILGVAPAVFFAHAYSGTCISGAKAFKSPVVTPCQRRFGWGCLGHYYPHRCGGWNPWTMWREFWEQAGRLQLLRRYRALLTASRHMRAEYLKHGFDSAKVFTIPYPVGGQVQCVEPAPAASRNGVMAASRSTSPSAWRLLFLGRMDLLKGGHVLLEALPRVKAGLDQPVSVVFAGDGPERPRWERQAARVQSEYPGVRIQFTGWVSGGRLDELWERTDLLVMPSLWPEPFGLGGPEAGLRSVPAAAFAVGGIPDWLTDGVNGHLAPGSCPTAAGLAEAILQCLRDPATHARLRRGALEMAQRFGMESHLDALLTILEMVSPRASASPPTAVGELGGS